ncbi:Cathepsin L1 [Folsomia candida]|uniref:Cathepsin L1 n=2 Tax=Folsomia candida TaxID=158441 RepID=A0A226DVM4_FOLCA|nr:Cathepsin L1 [Folsomia candida]
MNIVSSALKQINAHNSQKGKSFSLGLNQFSDLSEDEYFQKKLGIRSPPPNSVLSKPAEISGNAVETPETLDWRKQGLVTRVKNQGQCASCGFFDTIGSVEAVLAKKTGKLIALSEQQPGDCAYEYFYPKNKKRGMCDGVARADIPLEYIKHVGGIMSEEDYPYTAENGDECKYDPSKSIGSISDYKVVDLYMTNSTQRNLLKSYVASVGPIAVIINAGPREFMYYRSGVYRPSTCDGRSGTHGVLLVGYGKEKADEYWILKNSWGRNWGEKGYIRMALDFKIKGNCYEYELGPYYPMWAIA